MVMYMWVCFIRLLPNSTPCPVWKEVYCIMEKNMRCVREQIAVPKIVIVSDELLISTKATMDDVIALALVLAAKRSKLVLLTECFEILKDFPPVSMEISIGSKEHAVKIMDVAEKNGIKKMRKICYISTGDQARTISQLTGVSSVAIIESEYESTMNKRNYSSLSLFTAQLC